jgi:hypothetical protein
MPSPTNQATAAALYEQPQFADPDDGQGDRQGQEEQRLVLSPERLAWLEELQRRIGALADQRPKSQQKRRRHVPDRLPAAGRLERRGQGPRQ